MPMFLESLRMYQFIVAALSVTMIVFGIHKYMTHQAGQSPLKLMVRIVVWGGMMAVALFPVLTNKLADIIGLQGNINAVILTGFLLVFLLIFKILSVVERIEQDLSTLTRRETLRQLNTAGSKQHDNKA